MNSQKAVDFIAEVAKQGKGVYDVLLPKEVLGRIILENGKEVVANMARVVVKANGAIRTAFPFNSKYPT